MKKNITINATAIKFTGTNYSDLVTLNAATPRHHGAELVCKTSVGNDHAVRVGDIIILGDKPHLLDDTYKFAGYTEEKGIKVMLYKCDCEAMQFDGNLDKMLAFCPDASEVNGYLVIDGKPVNASDYVIMNHGCATILAESDFKARYE